MWMPSSVAASSTSVPLATRASRPSMLMPTRPSSGWDGGAWLTSGVHQRCARHAHRAVPSAGMALELVTERGVRRHHEPGRGVPERAEALAVHVVADVG